MKKKLFILLIVSMLTPMFFVHAESVTPAPFKILLVPGHDDDVWGAQYGSTREADMTLALGTRIYDILRKDKRFDVHITRNAAGYTEEFANYFADHRSDISAFKQNAKEATRNQISTGEFVEKENTPHNSVTEDVSIILYGINKWAGENQMDAVLHIHFNDYPRTNSWTIGKHKGFSIYMPEGQMANSRESAQLAANVFMQLDKKYATSTYEPEIGGLVAEQKLIAIGANGTLPSSVRSILTEYGYIYEKKFRTLKGRTQAYKDMASLTAAGIKNYFLNR